MFHTGSKSPIKKYYGVFHTQVFPTLKKIYQTYCFGCFWQIFVQVYYSTLLLVSVAEQYLSSKVQSQQNGQLSYSRVKLYQYWYLSYSTVQLQQYWQLIRSDRISRYRKNVHLYVRMYVCVYVSRTSNMTPDQARSTQTNLDQARSTQINQSEPK